MRNNADCYGPSPILLAGGSSRYSMPAAGCEGGAGAAAGSFYSYRAQIEFTQSNQEVRAVVEIDDAGGFLLESINCVPGIGIVDLHRLDMKDVQRNKLIFRNVIPGIFGPKYRGAADALPRPVFFPASSTIEFIGRCGPLTSGVEFITLQLNGWRYRGAGEGPMPADVREEFCVYVAEPGETTADAHLVTDADSDFICTQVLYPPVFQDLVPPETYHYPARVQIKTDRTNLFRDLVPLNVMRRPVGALEEQPTVWRVGPRSNLRIERPDEVPLYSGGILTAPMPLHLVGYRRYLWT